MVVRNLINSSVRKGVRHSHPFYSLHFSANCCSHPAASLQIVRTVDYFAKSGLIVKRQSTLGRRRLRALFPCGAPKLVEFISPDAITDRYNYWYAGKNSDYDHNTIEISGRTRPHASMTESRVLSDFVERQRHS
jgi:hypothetical protein